LDATATNKKLVVKDILKNLMKNPLLIVGIIGIFIASTNINFPPFIIQSLDMISASVTPTVLVVIGLFIGKSKIGNLYEWIPVSLFSLATLFLIPVLFYFGLILFSQQPNNYFISIVEAAMPLAITPFALADKYQLNKNFIARSVVLSTIMAVITLPIWISVLQ
jgi:predicted permease